MTKMIKLLILAGCCLVIIGIIMGYWASKQKYQNFSESKKTLANPLMGFTPRADFSELDDDNTLVYIDIYWSELEAKEGVYDWDTIESNYQFSRWRSEGKHAVLRFVCDKPSTNAHMDIPNWLYQKTKDGTNYDNDYGKGYSPNYSNSTFISSFKKTLAAMGDRWGSDTFISYIELGVLGHWGEWHTNLSKGSPGMPKESVRNSYVKPWGKAFPSAKILLRRPFAIAAQNNYGIYNDIFGKKSGTLEWLSWIKNGGTYNETGEKNALVAMPNFWKNSPSGGELTTLVSMKNLLVDNFDRTLSLLKKSHTTFLGPNIADKNVSKEAYNELLKNMGYRLWISDIHQVSARKFYVTWRNSGIAPIYWDWPVNIYISDGKSTKTLVQDFKISQVMPGDSTRMYFTLDAKSSKNWKKISLGIVDPMTGKDAIHFANTGQEDQTKIKLLEQ